MREPPFEVRARTVPDPGLAFALVEASSRHPRRPRTTDTAEGAGGEEGNAYKSPQSRFREGTGEGRGEKGELDTIFLPPLFPSQEEDHRRRTRVRGVET